MLFLMLISNLSQAGSVCNDGWVSSSEGSGACAYHGGVSHLCGGVERIGEGSVYYVWAPCPQPAGTSSADRYLQNIRDQHEKMWQLSLEQSRMEISSGQMESDQLISRAREIYIENWGSPSQKANLEASKREAQVIDSLKSIIEKIGQEHFKNWALYFREPGACWTSDTKRILIKTHLNEIITLEKGQSMLIEKSPEILKEYEEIVEMNISNLKTDKGQICNSN